MLTQAPLWLLDEPLNALDAAAQQAFRTVLQQHLDNGGLAIAATHADLGVPGGHTVELSAPQKALP
jgi:heme exporter protein A